MVKTKFVEKLEGCEFSQPCEFFFFIFIFLILNVKFFLITFFLNNFKDQIFFYFLFINYIYINDIKSIFFLLPALFILVFYGKPFVRTIQCDCEIYTTCEIFGLLLACPTAAKI